MRAILEKTRADRRPEPTCYVSLCEASVKITNFCLPPLPQRCFRPAFRREAQTISGEARAEVARHGFREGAREDEGAADASRGQDLAAERLLSGGVARAAHLTRFGVWGYRAADGAARSAIYGVMGLSLAYSQDFV